MNTRPLVRIGAMAAEPATLDRRIAHLAQDGVDHSRADHSDDHWTGAQWSDCPGCPKCTYPDRPENNGWILRKGSWRTTSSHEYIYMLTKGMGYYADGEAVKTAGIMRGPVGFGRQLGQGRAEANQRIQSGNEGVGIRYEYDGTANRRSVWNDISPEPYGG